MIGIYPKRDMGSFSSERQTKRQSFILQRKHPNILACARIPRTGHISKYSSFPCAVSTGRINENRVEISSFHVAERQSTESKARDQFRGQSDGHRAATESYSFLFISSTVLRLSCWRVSPTYARNPSGVRSRQHTNAILARIPLAVRGISFFNRTPLLPFVGSVTQ